MRPPASGKLEIIRLVEQSHLPARRTLEMLGMKPRRFIVSMTDSGPAGRKPSKTSRDRSPLNILFP